jgi:hypothetical protein
VSNYGVVGGAGISYSYVAEIPTQRLRARTASIALMGSFVLGIAFNYTVPLMLKAWSVRTGYLYANPSACSLIQNVTDVISFGAAGVISCVVGFFVLPEITCRTPAEIDEMFEDEIAPRKFRKHVTQVQVFLEEKGHKEHMSPEDKA